jgi:hypothetical protein
VIIGVGPSPRVIEVEERRVEGMVGVGHGPVKRIADDLDDRGHISRRLRFWSCRISRLAFGRASLSGNRRGRYRGGSGSGRWEEEGRRGHPDIEALLDLYVVFVIFVIFASLIVIVFNVPYAFGVGKERVVLFEVRTPAVENGVRIEAKRQERR